MVEILNLEKIETEQNGELSNLAKDTWIMKLPKEICQREGLAEGTLVSMTIKNSGIQAKFIAPPSENLLEISRQILEEDRELYQRLKEIGD